MTIKRKILSFIAVTGMLANTSCTKDFEELNTDPDRLKEVNPASLMNPVIYDMATYGINRYDAYTAHIMQVRVPFPSVSDGVHRYVLNETIGNGPWNTYYRMLTNINEMLRTSVTYGHKTYQGIALTLRANATSVLTDCFGNIPFSQSGLAEQGNTTPVFDEQKDIYTQLIADLDSANTLLTANQAMNFGADNLYGSSATTAIANWRKFANSLRLRLLLRVSNKAEMNAYQKMVDMVNNPAKYPVFTSNAEAAIFKITGATPNISPWGRAQDYTTGYSAAEFFVDKLNDVVDPRRAKFMSQAKSTGTPAANIGYKGIPSAYSGEQQFNFVPSNMQQAMIIAPMIAPVMTYAELEFILAELCQKGHLPTAEAQLHYEKGVKAAIEQWGLTVPATYFSDADAAYNGTLGRIMIQKYLALYFNDYQQWFEYRRTGLPALPVGPDAQNGGKMPVRFKYPITTQTTNYANWKAAIASMGGDDINTKVWWEK